MSDSQRDETLMQAYRKGEVRAFLALYARHRGGLFRFLLHQCGRRERAEALYQEIWLAAIAGRGGAEGAARFAPWLYRLAHQHLLDSYRRRGRSAELEDDAPAGELPEAAATPEGPLAGHLVAAVEALPAPAREAFLMAVEGGLSGEDIARATGTGPETARRRLADAGARLRAALGEPPPGDDDLYALWRQGTQAEPTPMLDDLILRAARAEVAPAPPARPWWAGWQGAVWLAAAVILGVSISQRVGEKEAPPAAAAVDEARPQHWLAHIRALRAAGRASEAAANLARFRARYPEYPLPDDLK